MYAVLLSGKWKQRVAAKRQCHRILQDIKVGRPKIGGVFLVLYILLDYCSSSRVMAASNWVFSYYS
jgi:hypothetical protein